MRKIILTVDTKGNSTIKTEGYAGQDCVKASAKIAVALGKTVSDDATPEMFQEATCGINVQN